MRTGPASRAEVRLSNLSVLPVNASTTLTFEAPAVDGGQPILNLSRGSVYFQSRDRPREIQFRTRLASGAVRGTEFHLSVEEDDRTVLTLLDGEVDLSNEQGQVTLARGEQGVVEAGKAPVKTAVLDAINIIQWGHTIPACWTWMNCPERRGTATVG